MARKRFIKPSLMTNEDLCDLGPFAYILLTSLWMLADREGRLEDRPRRIKAEGMPMWDEVSAKDINSLLDKLDEAGFLTRYECSGKRCIEITDWRKDQNPHPREIKSDLPGCGPGSPQANPRSTSGEPWVSLGLTLGQPLVSLGLATSPPENPKAPSLLPAGGVINELMAAVSTTSEQVNLRLTLGAPEANLRLTLGSPQDSMSRADSNPNTMPSDTCGGVGRLEEGCGEEPFRPPTDADKPHFSHSGVGQQLPSDDAGTLPLSRPILRAGSPGELAVVRASLVALGKEVGMGIPDEDIVRRTLAAARGATGLQVHEALVELWKRGKFRGMYSWGLVPKVIDEIWAHACSAA